MRVASRRAWALATLVVASALLFLVPIAFDQNRLTRLARLVVVGMTRERIRALASEIGCQERDLGDGRENATDSGSYATEVDIFTFRNLILDSTLSDRSNRVASTRVDR